MKNRALAFTSGLAVGLVALTGCSATSDALAQSPGSRPVNSPSSSRTYTLPGDGWEPGDPSLTALTEGEFHAGRVGDQVCAWLGDFFRPMLWPDGYNVRLNPAELIAPDGTVIAHEGDWMNAGGGGHNAKPGTPCAKPGEWTWDIEGTPGVSESSAPSPASVSPASPSPTTTTSGIAECSAGTLKGDAPYELPTEPGYFDLVITLTNTSTAPCKLAGYPTVQVTVAATGKPQFDVVHATTAFSLPTGVTPSTLTLQPRNLAYVYLVLANADLAPNLGCNPPRAVLTLGISGQRAPVYINTNFEFPGCLHTQPAKVSPFTTVAP